MDLHFNYANIESSDALEAHVRTALESCMRRYGDRLTRIEVHIGDVNSSTKKGPADKRCMYEARPKGTEPVVAESHADTYYTAATDAAHKLRQALEHRLKD